MTKRIRGPPAELRRGCRAAQRGPQTVQQLVRSVLANFHSVAAVEEDALLGKGQLRSGAGGLELYRRHRDGDPRIAAIHRVAVDDPLVRHDVIIACFVRVTGAAGRPAAIDLTSADPKVELEG